MSVTHVAPGGHGPTLPVRIPKKHSQVSQGAQAPIGSPGSIASSSSAIDRIVYGASPTSTLQESIQSNHEHAERLYTDLNAAIDELTSLHPKERLARWQDIHEQSKPLAFADSASLHRDVIAKLIAHLGYLDESPSETQLRHVFRDEFFEPVVGSPRALHEPTETAIRHELAKIPDTMHKVNYLGNMIPAMRVALLDQKHAFLNVLYPTMRSIKESGLSDNDLKETRKKTSNWKVSTMLATLSNYKGEMEDLIYHCFTDIDTFATPEIRAEILAEAKKYPNRPNMHVPSSRLVASTHTL